MSLESDVRRGELARQVLENEVYADAYTALETEITRAWRDARNKDDREELHRALRSLDKVRSVMEAAMKSGRIAADKLRADRSRIQRLGDYLKAG